MNGNPHDCERVEALLPDYLEGEMAPAEATALVQEARACPRCSELLADLAEIRRDAASLPSLQPGRDLWEGIAARIAPEVISIGDRAAATRPADVRPVRRRYTSPVWLAAAAMILVIVTATATWMAVGGNTNGTFAGGDAGYGVTPTAGSFALASVEAPYRDEIDMLRELVDERRTELDSATVAVIERNLIIIDQAIAESRQALARDTTNRFLRNQLDGALERKVELLRTAAMLPLSRI